MVAKFGTFDAVTMGDVATASSEAPITMTGFAEAIIWFAAGTASAGSPFVSNDLHAKLWFRTPPAALTCAMPDRQPAMPVAPWSALAPVNG